MTIKERITRLEQRFYDDSEELPEEIIKMIEDAERTAQARLREARARRGNCKPIRQYDIDD